MSYDKCTKQRKDPRIVLRENKSTFVAINNSRKVVYETKVDGCYINGSAQRCDYMLRVDTPNRVVYLIELKGRHIEHAVSQLKETLTKMPDCVNGYKRECCIVATCVPKARTNLQKSKIELKRAHNANLKVRSGKLEIEV